MKKLFAALCGGTFLLSLAATSATPALALGGCGPNGHRDFYGRCVFGGQNQAYCLRRTGHPAVRMPNGNLRCF